MTIAHDAPAVRAPSAPGAGLASVYRNLVVLEEVGYRVRFTHFPIVGTCSECQSLPDEEPAHH